MYYNSSALIFVSVAAVTSNNLALNSISVSEPDDATRRITPAEAKSQSTYEAIGWDFKTVWEMVPGKDYPQLRKLGSSSQTPIVPPDPDPSTDPIIEKDITMIIGEERFIGSGDKAGKWNISANVSFPQGQTINNVIGETLGYGTLVFTDSDGQVHKYKVFVTPNKITDYEKKTSASFGKSTDYRNCR
jgi:hypothetical protein